MFDRITVLLPVEGLLFWKLSGQERLDCKTLLGQPVTVCISTQGIWVRAMRCTA